MPIGIHCRPSASQQAEEAEAWDEIFGVVASPQTGKVIRAHLYATRENANPVAFGRMLAEVLLEEGAGPLLAAGAEAAGGAA